MTPPSANAQDAFALRVICPLLLCTGIFALAQPMARASEQPMRFQSQFMYQGANAPAHAGQLALDELARRNALGPGRYLVEISMNLRTFDHRELDFVAGSQGQLRACLGRELLEELGVNLATLDEPALLDEGCPDVQTLIPGAFTDFDSANLMLSISVPQLSMRRDSHRSVPVERWDPGINSAFVNYQAGLQYGHSAAGRTNQSQRLLLLSGLNLGAWRLRSNQSLTSDERGSRWDRAYTYVERDVPGTHARMTLGETYTGGEIMSSVPILGASIASDLGMLPDSAQSYAPIVRGVAQSRARLEILQNGYPIYSTYVSAGPYEIDDLSTGGGSGELEVVLTEANGQVRRYTQAYSGLSNLLRQGTWRYRASLGRYNAKTAGDRPLLWAGDLARGIGWQSTLYGGLLGSDFYQARTLGLSRDFAGWGAVSLDVTQSDADLGAGRNLQGMSYAMRYGKSFSTRTNVRFAGYRYSTETYRDFDEALAERTYDSSFRGSRRSRLEASVYQGVGKSSSFSLSMSREDFWGSDYERKQFQLYFNSAWRDLSYSLYASQSLATAHVAGDREFGFSVSVPLATRSRTLVTYDARNSANQWSQRGSVSGSFDEHRYTYNASVTQQDGARRNGAVSLARQGALANVSGGYSQGRDYKSLSLSASGALLVHSDGIVLGPYMGETMGLVHVPNTPGVGVANTAATKTNASGYALVPNLQPYRINQIELKTDYIGPEVRLENGTTQLVPTRGAVVKAQFVALRNQPVVINARDASGAPLPFGAQVLDTAGQMLSVVGQAGQIMLAGLDNPQTLHVRWAQSLCELHLDPETMETQGGYRLQALACAASPAAFGNRSSQEHADDV